MAEITKKEIKSYLEEDNSSLNTFRTLILFGKNSATYKFAFCHSLLKLTARNEVKYDDLRDEFVKELLAHYEKNPHQFSRESTKLTQAMGVYLKTSQNETDWNTLLTVAENSIYNNVFDAFQNVGNGTINKEYQLFEHDKKNKKLVLTDNVNLILEDNELKETIHNENQSRWNIVEEAWRAGLAPNMLDYNEDDKTFYSVSDNYPRIGLRSAVDVLMPYQKGHCFYCNRKMSSFVSSQDDAFPDVDHFLPYSMLNNNDLNVNPNGVWNLVIACKSCNRGADGKFDEPPKEMYYKKLKLRNLLFVEEHKHSLRNSILLSLNVANKQQLSEKMDNIYSNFRMIKGWKPRYIFDANNE